MGANSSMSTCEPSGAEATGSADLECAVENSVPTIDKIAPGAEPTDSADLECAVEASVPAIDEVTVPVTNPVVTEEVAEVIPDLCKRLPMSAKTRLMYSSLKRHLVHHA